MRCLSLAIALLGAACSAEPSEDSRCTTYEAGAPQIDDAIAIGVGEFEGFESIDENGSLELELGIQGGWMARPVLRIDGLALGADAESCVWVSSRAVVEGLDEPISTRETPEFHYEEGVGYSRPLELFLSFDLETVEQRTSILEVTVEGPMGASTATVDVILVNLE
jgi:hypothetical protein